jgi:hypothetical protein
LETTVSPETPQNDNLLSPSNDSDDEDDDFQPSVAAFKCNRNECSPVVYPTAKRLHKGKQKASDLPRFPKLPSQITGNIASSAPNQGLISPSDHDISIANILMEMRQQQPVPSLMPS